MQASGGHSDSFAVFTRHAMAIFEQSFQTPFDDPLTEDAANDAGRRLVFDVVDGSRAFKMRFDAVLMTPAPERPARC
jgi:hypothetical protein